MASKATINEVQFLREYCERRWQAQDDYFESCFNLLRTGIITLFAITLLGSFVCDWMLVSKVNKLQNRVQTIEQTWSK